jgi:homoisocitrate dehydrogenase
VVRENTEDLYLGRERLEDDGATAIAERVITRAASERIARAAYDLARRRKAAGDGPGKVTIVHKANVLRVSDGLFRESALAVAREYDDLVTEELLVDTAAMHLARTPERFDVIVTTNMFGDILSDIAAVHGGGLGLASSANYGTSQALFEPVHGAAPDIVGKQIANPLAAISCIGMFLELSACSKQSPPWCAKAPTRPISVVRPIRPISPKQFWLDWPKRRRSILYSVSDHKLSLLN